VGKKWLKEEVNLGAEGGSDPGLDERKKIEILAEPETRGLDTRLEKKKPA
jgi:hypothetical protein